MKLIEITRPSRTEAEEILSSAGYKKIGEGSFAEVYARDDSDHVLKLFSSKDFAYKTYLDLIKSNKNIHFPIIKGAPYKVTAEYYAVRLERLTPFNEKEKILQDIDLYLSIKSQASNISKTSDLEQRLSQTILDACNLILSIDIPTNYRNNTRKAHFDIKTANFMMRGSTIVFVDPIH